MMVERRAGDFRTGWTVVTAHPDFRLVASAGLVSMTGDWLLHIGLAFLVYDMTGSTLASGATLIAAVVPSILLGSVAGVLVDRWDRRRTMIGCDVLQIACLAPLLLVDAQHVWIIYLVALAQGCVEPFFEPAEQALIPSLVPESRLLSANALNGQNRNIARLVGSCAGGAVAARGGLTALAVIDAATFAASAALVLRVRATTPQTEGGPTTRSTEPRDPQLAFSAAASARRTARALAVEWSEGLSAIRGRAGLRTVLVFTLITAVGEGIMGTLMAPWVRDVVHGGGQAYGVILGVQAVGGVVGGAVATSVGDRANPRLMFGAGALVFGALDLALFCYPLVWPHVAPAVCLMIVIGVPGALAMAGRTTVLQLLTEDRLRGRVFGAIGAVQGVALLMGIAAASLLGGAVGILPIIALQGLAYVLGGLLVLSWLPRQLATVDSGERAPAAASAVQHPR